MSQEPTNITPLENPPTKITPCYRHEKYVDLQRILSLNLPCYIYGPTGSGKTRAVEDIAREMKLPFYRKVVSAQTSEGQLFGFNNATSYVEGIAFKPYTQGGILLIDEIDNGNPNVNVALKMLVEGDQCYFPNGLQTKHVNFQLVANANTIGVGATRQYVGRSAQDAALLNIFAFLQWDYDPIFEYSICKQEYLDFNGTDMSLFRSFITNCWKFRAAIEKLSLRHIVSPRNIKNGARMLGMGMDKTLVLNSLILRGLEESQAKKIMEEAQKEKLDKKHRDTIDEDKERSGENKQKTPDQKESDKNKSEIEEILEKMKETTDNLQDAKSFEKLEELFTKKVDDEVGF